MNYYNSSYCFCLILKFQGCKIKKYIINEINHNTNEADNDKNANSLFP